MHYPDLLLKYSLVSDQVDKKELGIILEAFEQCLVDSVAGDVVEFGCYTGTTSLFLERLIVSYGGDKQLHVYDSFAGLPEKSMQDSSPVGTHFKAGELLATKKELIAHFKKAGLRTPYIHKAWFSDLASNDVPDSIAFAYLDGDFYASILDPLKLIWNKLSSGACVAVDDYGREALPGVTKAVDEFCSMNSCGLSVHNSIALIRPAVASERRRR